MSFIAIGLRSGDNDLTSPAKYVRQSFYIRNFEGISYQIMSIDEFPKIEKIKVNKWRKNTYDSTLTKQKIKIDGN